MIFVFDNLDWTKLEVMIDGEIVMGRRVTCERRVGENEVVVVDHDANAPTLSMLKKADNATMAKILPAYLTLIGFFSKFILSFALRLKVMSNKAKVDFVCL